MQKEVIQATLANDFGIDVDFRETTTICIERPVGTGAAVEIIGKAPNPFLATVGLRVEPAADRHRRGRSGWRSSSGRCRSSFFTAVEETVRETLRQGIYGWQVTDCMVTMTHSGYCAAAEPRARRFDKSMSSTAGDFRNLTPLVLMSALQQAGTTVYEPMHRFRPRDPGRHARLGAARCWPGCAPCRRPPAMRGSSCMLEGEIPAARVHELQQQLPALTRGEGVLECAFDRYQPVRGAIPTRPRTDHNPLNRKEYLLRVVRRVGGRREGA